MSTVSAPGPGTEPPHRRQHVLERTFFGLQGLRAGWSVLLAYILFYLFRMVIGTIYLGAHLVSENSSFNAVSALTLESIPLLAMLGAGAIMAVIEHRRLVDYNLSGTQVVRHFFSGLLTGAVGLSALIGALHFGGWLRFGPAGLWGLSILRFAVLWGCAFLVIGFVEEGLFRCFLQFTLTRGLNFWWALAAEVALCLYLISQPQNRGVWGVYALVLLGLLPCFILQQRAAARSAFWQAAWVTSTFFAMIHTFNGGENWIGILAAGGIGFVFCASVRVTGSAWWAIGCHSAWDWTETYFYGTADSGLPARGHLLSTSPAGNPLFSGGADGPEGSVLVFGAILLVLFLVLVTNAHKKRAVPGVDAIAWKEESHASLAQSDGRGFSAGAVDNADCVEHKEPGNSAGRSSAEHT